MLISRGSGWHLDGFGFLGAHCLLFVVLLDWLRDWPVQVRQVRPEAEGLVDWEQQQLAIPAPNQLLSRVSDDAYLCEGGLS